MPIRTQQATSRTSVATFELIEPYRLTPQCTLTVSTSLLHDATARPKNNNNNMTLLNFCRKTDGGEFCERSGAGGSKRDERSRHCRSRKKLHRHKRLNEKTCPFFFLSRSRGSGSSSSWQRTWTTLIRFQCREKNEFVKWFAGDQFMFIWNYNS